MENNERNRLNRDDHAKIERIAHTAKKGAAYVGGLLLTAGTLANKVNWGDVAETLGNTAAKVGDMVRKII